MIHLLYGTDDYSVNRQFRSIKDSLGEPEALSNNTTILDGAKVSPEELGNYIQAMPFLGMHRLVIVENLIKRLDSGRGRTKKDGPTSADAYNAVLKNSLCPTTELVLIEGDLDPKTGKTAFNATGHPLFNGVKDLKVYACKTLSGDRLVRWINDYVVSHKGVIVPDAAKLIALNLGGDLWSVSGNIDKLLAYCNGREITKKDVELMVPELGNDGDIWALLKYALERNLPLAMKYYLRILDSGEDEYYVLVMLISQLRKVVRVKIYLAEGHRESELATLTKIPPFQIGSVITQAKNYTLDELIAFYKKFLETDVNMKTGVMNPETAVIVLITELCEGM